MPCWTTTSTWAPNIQVGLDTKQYVVELKRDVSCCNVDYQIFINGQELQDHGLFYSICGHLNSPGGSYEWEEQGHHFHLMHDVHLSRRTYNKYFRLFVDGIDVDTGLEFTAYWRRKAILLSALGCVLVFLAALAYILVFVVFKVNVRYLASSMGGANFLFCIGVAYVIMALIIFKKYTQQRSYVQYQPFRNV